MALKLLFPLAGCALPAACLGVHVLVLDLRGLGLNGRVDAVDGGRGANTLFANSFAVFGGLRNATDALPGEVTIALLGWKDPPNWLN
ncbi:hypothetical protein PF005_g26267 [Phytophthora fragariae]|uniref:Uncharacterized protein n=2 Tax=Phytophthora TaxID=4783 RepID=A0A6A3DYG2_9STRA|nr:hypothetical protein PF009_g24783 [Phytophthora fragariae]KAE9324223.1 hypothetical protein PR003_g16786 [Phytophthora rubi]KAE8973663.1 hypothetical protein PF011_g25161 [Phytophthora fragariae]KAE9072158.1 hypothetical protein PF007_g26284 [Phytophthora fragariae]KAE9072274.1 hypothetical protein PF010_g25552 [Phytophthora fragariae]